MLLSVNGTQEDPVFHLCMSILDRENKDESNTAASIAPTLEEKSTSTTTSAVNTSSPAKDKRSGPGKGNKKGGIYKDFWWEY